MKIELEKYLQISLATVALLIVVLAQNSIQAQDKEDSDLSKRSSNRIVGAWETTVTPVNCETGEQVAPSFNGVITFNEGGTVAEYGANPATPYRTPGHGIWESTGRRTNSMRFSFMPLTPAGAPVGRMRITQEGQVSRSGEESTSSGYFELTTFGGVVLATGCSTATAVRLSL